MVFQIFRCLRSAYMIIAYTSAMLHQYFVYKTWVGYGGIRYMETVEIKFNRIVVRKWNVFFLGGFVVVVVSEMFSGFFFVLFFVIVVSIVE